MRSNWKIPALSLALILAACGSPERPAAITEDLKRDLAAVSASIELSPAPKSYQRARFVSSIEQSRAGRPAKHPAPAAHAEHAMASHVPAAASPTTEVAPELVASDAVVAMTSESPAPASTPAASTTEPSIVIVQTPEPAREPARGPSAPSGGMIGDDGQGGLGGLIGGPGGAVIRGGHGGVDKCDPRKHERPQIPTSDRPTFKMPSQGGRSLSGGRR